MVFLVITYFIASKTVLSDQKIPSSLSFFSFGRNSYQTPSVKAEEEPTPPWSPKEEKTSSTEASPVIGAKSALVMDMTAEKYVYEKSPKMKLPIASLTKIMTAVVALESKPLDDLFKVSSTAASMEPDSMGLYPGEKLTLKQLLYGLLLVSGNDAAVTIAEGVSGSSEDFVKLMNQKAKALGMKDTIYVNPSGLQGEGNFYSTSYDLLLLTHYALQNPTFRQIDATLQYRIPEVFTKEENHKNFWLSNSSPLADYPGYIGGKPGYTPEAGKCLITLIEKNRHEILVIVLGSEDRKGDTIALLEYGFKVLGLN